MVLDKDQERIVTSNANNILVIASAGSGKTRVLTERVRYLIEEKGVDPKDIITITFTTAAASEMVDRLKDVKGIENAFVGTIHSFAYRALRSTNSHITLLTDDLDRLLHIELIKKYCSIITVDKYNKYTQEKLKCHLSMITKDELSMFLTTAEKNELRQIEVGPVNKKYPASIRTLCVERNIITFDQLIKLASDYFKSIGSTTEYVLVDEFQDIGNLEYKFIMSIGATNHFFVGDDWQSIYSFKGSNVELFKKLVRDKSYKKYYLTNNYRCCPEVIDYSLRIMDKVSDKFPKKVRSVRCDKGTVVTSVPDKLADMISGIRIRGDYSKWFILTRTNSDVYQLSAVLSNYGVPYTVFKRDGATQDDIDCLMKLNTVKLMTVHSSKGLENDNVILYGNFDINKKFRTRTNDPNYNYKLFRFEEELKVFYVGVTRARNKIMIINSDDFRRYN